MQLFRLSSGALPLLGALASTPDAEAQTAAPQTPNTLTALFRYTSAAIDPPRGFNGGMVDAFGFQINYDRTLSRLWTIQIENNRMFGDPGGPVNVRTSDLPAVPGYQISAARVPNTDRATRSNQTDLSIQGLVNVFCLWNIGESWKAGLLLAAGVNYAETTTRYVRHDIGSPARPGDTVGIPASDRMYAVSAYRLEMQIRAGLQLRFSDGIFSGRLESFYHINPRLEGSGPDEGNVWINRLSVSVTPRLGDFQFPFDARISLAAQRDMDHTYFLNPTLEFRVGTRIVF